MDMVNMDMMVDTDMVETDKMDTDNVRRTWTPVKLIQYWVRHAKYTWSSLKCSASYVRVFSGTLCRDQDGKQKT